MSPWWTKSKALVFKMSGAVEVFPQRLGFGLPHMPVWAPKRDVR